MPAQTREGFLQLAEVRLWPQHPEPVRRVQIPGRVGLNNLLHPLARRRDRGLTGAHGVVWSRGLARQL